jgi:peptidoglycan hydrolase CwlO-like protein
VTTPTKEEKEKMMHYFKGKHKFIIEQKALFKDRFMSAKPSGFTSFKTYSAFAYLVYDELADMFEMLQNIYENLAELDKDITAKTERLEKIINDVSSLADITEVKAELDELKGTMKEPMWTRIDQFLQAMKENEQKRKKLGEEYVE